MPLNWDNISAITTRKFIPILADAVYKSNPLFILLNSKGRIVLDGGRSIVEPILYAKQPGGSYEKFAPLDVTPKEVMTDLELQYKLYYAADTVSEHDLLKNYGTSRILDSLAAKMANMEATLKDNIGTDLLKNAALVTPTDIDSLDIAIDDGTNSAVYAGINRNTDGNPWWKAQYKDLALAEPSFSEFQKLYGKCTQGDTAPDLIVVTQNVFDKLWALALPAQRRDEGDDTTIGWPYLKFNRARIMVDSHVPAGKAFFINTEFVKLIVHTLRDFAFSGWLTSVNQDARTGRIHWAGNIVVNNPRFQGKMVNINEA